MGVIVQTPPELHDGRSDHSEILRLINWLRRRVTATGVVNDVTATVPITSSGGITPNIALNYDGVSLDLAAATTLRRAELVGDVTAPAGSNTLTLATVNPSPGTYTYATVTVNAKGLATLVAAGTPPAPATARYWLSIADAGLPNGVDMGALGTGVLQQTMALGVSTPQAVAVPEHAVLYGGPTGLLDYDASLFYFDDANVRVGIGTNTPDALATLTIRRNHNDSSGTFITNANGGTNASAQVVVQAGPSDTYGTAPYIAMAAFSPGLTPPGVSPFFTAGSGTLTFLTDVVGAHMIIDRGGSSVVEPDLIFTCRVVGPGQTEQMRLTYGGKVQIADLIGGGDDHLVYAMDVEGELALVTLGSGLSFVAGVLSATGSGGTVTSVTASSPLASSGGTTPNITHNTTAVTPGSYTYASLTVDAYGHLTAASSGAAPVTSVSGTAGRISSTGGTTPVLDLVATGVTPGSYTYTSLTVDAYGRLTAASNGVAPVTSISVTAPITSTGGTTPTIGHATSGAVAGTYNWANVTVNATGHVTTITANTAPQAAITWPAAPQVLFSTGVASDPDGNANITIDDATSQLRFLSATGNAAFYNLLSGGDFERALFFWTGNVFTVLSQAGGAGVVRNITIDAGTGHFAALSDVTGIVGTTTAYVNGPTINLDPGTGGFVTLTPAQSFTFWQPTVASGAGATLDSIVIWGGANITGSTNILTASGFNGTTFFAPTYSGNGFTISLAATVYIAGPPAVAGTATIANPYSLWIDTGEFRLDGSMAPSGGGTPVFSNTPGSPTQAVWIPIVSDGTPYMVPAWYRT